MRLRSVLVGFSLLLVPLPAYADGPPPAQTDGLLPAQADGLPLAHTGGLSLSWELKDTGVTARFRGLAPVSRDVVWAAGTEGTVLRTVDSGRTWQNVSPADASALQFRDVEAFDARRAVVLSIGEGGDSRIYRTEDAGRTWNETFRNDEQKAFYDCMAFFDRRHGLAMSDPVDGKFRILATEDGGRSWQVLPSAGMPDALPSEAGFAASGQCLIASGRDAWLASGGATQSRVYHSSDRGRTWTVTSTPIPAGDPARGVFALAFRDPHRGLAVGGDYRADQPSPSAGALTRDGGATWQPSATPPPAYRSGVTWIPYLPFAAITVGPSGSDVTYSGGRDWRTFDTGSFDTVSCTPDLTCWASGEKGRIARLTAMPGS